MTDHAVPRSLIALPPALAHAGLVVGGTIVGIMVVAALFGVILAVYLIYTARTL